MPLRDRVGAERRDRRVRSSSISTGIGSEPERSTTARSAASCGVKRPSIWPRLPMRERIDGAL